MGTLVTSKPVVSTVVDATVLANNFTAIENVINGGIDNSNINAAAAIAISKLQGYPSDSTKFLRGDATWAAPAAGSTYYRKTTSKTVNNTVTETDLLNGEITIAANPGINSVTRLTAWGDCFQNTGANQVSNRWKFKMGGVTLLDTNIIPLSGQNPWQPSGNRTGWRILVEFQNLGVANAQTVSITLTHGLFSNSGSGAFFTTGGGWHGNYAGGGEIAYGTNTTSVDTTASKLVELSVTQPIASVSMETKLLSAVVEVF